MDAHIEALQFAQHLLHVLRVTEPVGEGGVVPHVDKIAQVIEETRGSLLGLEGDLIVAMEQGSLAFANENVSSASLLPAARLSSMCDGGDYAEAQ
jgi:hypothetical protein